ncbi:MAG: DUF4062 domain-containing protein [Rhodospirillales bacterium]|nr:DUF4062 domain-containing protein [Rhodospirillales bacterium]
MKRPIFFLSSTIYDFRDLRSALKFTLEDRGCQVLASEFNDFGGDLDQHSYESCIANIERADFFVLLIGGRVGGWYDKTNRVSITQQEYRAAYERHQKGLLKIVTFVRSEIWQLREDRRALEKHLQQLKVDESERREILDYPSKFTTDAEFISKFLAEVGRNAETKQAVQNGTPMPTGNWIHTFSSFRDIQDALSPLAFSGLSAEEAAYSKALQHELLAMLSQLVAKHEGKPSDYRRSLKKHMTEYPIHRDTKFDDYFEMEMEEWQKFSFIMFQLLGVQLNSIMIDDALKSSLFLDYDPKRGQYTQSPAFDALYKILSEIRAFNSSNTHENLSLMFEFSPKNLGRKTGQVHLPLQKLLVLRGIAQRWINIVSLAICLVEYLEGRAFKMPELMPLSPVEGMDDEILRETLSIEEVRTALGI